MILTGKAQGFFHALRSGTSWRLLNSTLIGYCNTSNKGHQNRAQPTSQPPLLLLTSTSTRSSSDVLKTRRNCPEGKDGKVFLLYAIMLLQYIIWSGRMASVAIICISFSISSSFILPERASNSIHPFITPCDNPSIPH